MSGQVMRFVLAAAVTFAIVAGYEVFAKDDRSWQSEFGISSCKLLTTGRSRFFVLEPGSQHVLEGGNTRLQITVLDETYVVDGVTTRVVEEREWQDGKLHEISRNYFAMCENTKDVFYFGEDVDFYENGNVVRHDGTWHAGVDGNKAGLMMPGTPKLGMKYYQEVAPNVAMDRAEIVGLFETCTTPAGTFTGCIKVKEGSALERSVVEYKYYAPGIGRVVDGNLKLVRRGLARR
jgi:hypothetical protein